MTLDEIERLLHRLAQTDITSIEISDESSSLTLRLAPGLDRQRIVTAIEASAVTTPMRALRAPGIGRLCLRHPEAAQASDAPFPRLVRAGDIVAFLEAGLFFRPVVAEDDGTLGEPMVPEGTLVGYGTPLFPIL